MAKAAIVGVDETVWEGAWATEFVEGELQGQGVDTVVLERSEGNPDHIVFDELMEEGVIGALVLANLEPDSGDIFDLDDHMKQAAQLAAEAGIPIFSIRRLKVTDLETTVKPELIICRPNKLCIVRSRLERGES